MDQHITAKIMFVIFIVFIIVSVIFADDYDNRLPSLELPKPPTEVYTPTLPTESNYPTQTTPDNSKMWDYRAPTYDIYNYDRAPVE